MSKEFLKSVKEFAKNRKNVFQQKGKTCSKKEKHFFQNGKKSSKKETMSVQKGKNTVSKAKTEHQYSTKIPFDIM